MHKYTMSKNQRLLAIRKIIGNSRIETQEELLEKLLRQGYHLTQATLSRDLKSLKVAKKADPDKGYIYFIPENAEVKEEKKSREKFPVNGFMWLKFSDQLGVIKTKPGYASSIATLIDSSNSFEILATIAGDDTILIIPVEGMTKQDVIRALILIMPDLEGKI